MMKEFLIRVYLSEYFGENRGTENTLVIDGIAVMCLNEIHVEKMAEAIAAGLNVQGAPTRVGCESAYYWATWGED